MDILEIHGITKKYPGVTALNQVSASFRAGEIHALIGENGAGKSTLIKIIAGAVAPSEGVVCIHGERFEKLTPSLAKEKGIGVVYQEFNLVDSLNVAENIFLGDRVGGKLIQDKKEIHARTEKILAELNIHIDTYAAVGSLSTSQQQMVEIAKAICKNTKVIILDEPSAAISVAEVMRLFDILRTLKKKGVCVVYISHRLDELFEIADRVTVLRDGCYIATREMKDITRQELVNMMVGRELKESFPKRESVLGEVILETRNLTGNGVSDANISLRRGEVLGLAGLVGAGRTELAKVIFGAAPMISGELLLHGRPVKMKKTSDAVRNGIAIIPEDRAHEGVFLDFPIDWNIGISCLKLHSTKTVLRFKELEEVSKNYASVLQIKTPSLQQLVKNLSGGNQQKVALAKALSTMADILIFDEPTRGIDVGAKQEIYVLINALIQQGKSIIMISSELEELIGMSDRMYVLYEGKVAGELQKNEFSQNRILELASGM